YRDPHRLSSAPHAICLSIPRSANSPSLNALLKPQPPTEPKWIEPMQAKLARSLPAGGDWLYELKIDGYWALAIRDGANLSLVSRNGNDFTDRFPAVVEGLRQLKPRQFVLDGEIVALDDKGRPSFQKLQNAFRRGSTNHTCFYAFDLVNLGG